MSPSRTQIVALVGGPLDGRRWQLGITIPGQMQIVVLPNYCGPALPARTVRYTRAGEGKFTYDRNYER